MPSPRRRALSFAVWDGAVLAAHNALTTAVVLAGFLILLGATPRDFALAQAISVLAQGAPALIAPWLEGSARRRTILTLTLGRLLWMPALALPWLLPPGQAVGVFLGLYLVNRMLEAVGQASWLTWMSSLVPARMRGRYFARRNAVQLLSGLCVGIAAAVVLDRTGRSAASYAGLLASTLVLSAASAFLMRAQPEAACEEPARAQASEGPGRSPGSIPIRSPASGDRARFVRFVRFLLFFTLWGLGNGLSQPFWAAFELEHLRVSFGLLAAIAAAGSLAGALALPLWGRLADRTGDRPVLVATIAWGSFHPLLWWGMTPERLWPLWIDGISSGIVWNGFELAATNLLLRLAPAGSGELAYGSLAAVRGISGAVASLAAGFLVGWLPAVSVGGVVLGPMQFLLVAAAPVRWACLAMVWLVEDPRKRISTPSAPVCTVPAKC